MVKRINRYIYSGRLSGLFSNQPKVQTMTEWHWAETLWYALCKYFIISNGLFIHLLEFDKNI